jgi:chloramphenicol-sensitive protein RarD
MTSGRQSISVMEVNSLSQFVPPDDQGGASARTGALMGLSAYTIWTSFPLYFKALGHVGSAEILAHRIVWSALFLIAFLAVTGAGGQLRSLFSDRKSLKVLIITALLVSTNWFTFIYAVTTDRVLESSLGYYINPLVSILLAAVFLGERTTRRQKVSIALAASGVAVQTYIVGRLPAISLVLAFTFGLYGLVRKAARVPAVTGLAVETALISPLALAYLLWLGSRGDLSFLSAGTGTDALLLLTGVVTSTPLVLYGAALNRVRLSTMGIMQFIVPTGHFLWAVFAFGEPFTTGHLVSFGFIWAGLVLYSSETIGISRLMTQATVR